MIQRCLRAPWGRWNILTCLFSLSLRLFHCVCAHLNICNDKYSWFSYRIVTLTCTMKHSGHPGKWSWVYSNVPSLHPCIQTVHSPVWSLVVIFISKAKQSSLYPFLIPSMWSNHTSCKLLIKFMCVAWNNADIKQSLISQCKSDSPQTEK